MHKREDADGNLKMKGCMDVISEAQDLGIIGSHGVSCHTFPALKTAAAEPWVEIDLPRLKPALVAMDAPPAEVIAVLKQM